MELRRKFSLTPVPYPSTVPDTGYLSKNITQIFFESLESLNSNISFTPSHTFLLKKSTSFLFHFYCTKSPRIIKVQELHEPTQPMNSEISQQLKQTSLASGSLLSFTAVWDRDKSILGKDLCSFHLVTQPPGSQPIAFAHKAFD